MRFRSRKKCGKTACFVERLSYTGMEKATLGDGNKAQMADGVSKAIEKNGSENPNRSFLKMNGEATNTFSSAEGESVRVLHSQWR